MKTFDEFWPHFLREHAHPMNRRLHLVGMAIVHIILFYVFITGHIFALWFVPLVGFGFSWAGHFFVQRNIPVTFKHPIWSLVANLRMFYLYLFKKM